jgi:hypothetical protein
MTRTPCEPGPRIVVFERNGKELSREKVTNGKKAVTRAVNILLAHSELHDGDCLRIEAAD